MGQLISLVDEQDFKAKFLTMLNEDSNFRVKVRDIMDSDITKGIKIPSYTNWKMGIEGHTEDQFPIRVDNNHNIKMRAHSLNVDKLYVGGTLLLSENGEIWV